jgi:hypothetical protein
MANNFTDASAIDDIARRLAARIPLAPPRMRSARLFTESLRADPRCARALSRTEAKLAPDWARRAFRDGAPVAAFEPHPEAVADLRRIARNIKEACAEFAYLSTAPKEELSTRDVVIRQLAGEFVAKMERMPLDVVAEKARFFARERAQRLKEAKANKPLFDAESVFAAPGRIWRRIVSVGELSSLGREFGNCLAKATRHHLSYARRLKLDQARFWVLRDETGAGRIVAMVETVSGRLVEARGVRNASTPLDHPDLLALLRASAAKALAAQAEARARIDRGARAQLKDDRC